MKKNKNFILKCDVHIYLNFLFMNENIFEQKNT